MGKVVIAVCICAMLIAGWYGWLIGRTTRVVPAPRPAAEAKPILRPHAIGYLGSWGVTEEGRVWGIVVLPRDWGKPGDTLILLTVNARKETKP